MFFFQILNVFFENIEKKLCNNLSDDDYNKNYENNLREAVVLLENIDTTQILNLNKKFFYFLIYYVIEKFFW